MTCARIATEASTKPPTKVAYGCNLTSIIDYTHFLVLLPLKRKDSIPLAIGTHQSTLERENVVVQETLQFSIEAGKVASLVRGDYPSDAMMRNCAIVHVNIYNENSVTTATVKIFKQYLHFCRVSDSISHLLADYICGLLRETQSYIDSPERLAAHVQTLEHLNSDDARDATLEYFSRHNVCAPDLDHDEVVATLVNHATNLGTRIHTPRLAKLLHANPHNWQVTFDNALSMAIRVAIPYDLKKYHTFTIHTNGNILYSARSSGNVDSAKESLVDYIRQHLPQISL